MRLVSTMVVFAAGLSVAWGASAQTVSHPPRAGAPSLPADSVGAHASESLKSIRGGILRVDRYYERLHSASSEDSLVIRSQLFDLQSRILTEIHALGTDLIQLEKRGPQPELRAEVERIYDRATPRVWQYLRVLRGGIDRQRALRPATPPAQRPRLEDGIARLSQRLDTVYQLGFTHLGMRASLGIVTPADSAAYRDEVDERADELVGRMKLSSERISDLMNLQKETPDDREVKTLLVAEKRALKSESTSMTTLLPIMDALRMSTRSQREELVLVTRDLSSGVMDVGVAVQIASRAWNRARVWFRSNGPAILIKLLLFVGIILLFRLLARLVRGAIGKALDRKQGTSVLLRRMAVQSVGAAVMVLGLVIALGQIGISLGPLVAGLGVAGFIVGFALQDTLSNFASGLMILMYRPYDVGDVVEITGAFGKVERMSLVSTNIVTFDNQMIVVPNSKIWGDVIKNVTHQSMRRVDMVFGISYADDIPKAERLLEAIIKAHAKVLDDPAPIIKLNKLNDSSVDFIVRPWVMRDDYWDVHWDVTREVKMRFDAEGISIPFPQRDVHVYQKK